MLIAERTRQFIKNRKLVSLNEAKRQFKASRKQLGQNEHPCPKIFQTKNNFYESVIVN
jgi:hypothetical protein